MIRCVHTTSVRLSVAALGLILAACGGLPTTTAPPSQTLEAPASEIDRLLSELTEADSFTGAVLVARNGERLLNRGYGWADRDRQTPNTPQTRYRLASVTKQFTAMAVMILQDQGRLDAQDFICDHIPDCPASWEAVTLHHLLTHTSGIPNFTDFPEYEAIKATPSPVGQTIARFKDRPLDFEPGQEIRYSNSGYLVLGYMIEQVSGQSYEAFLRQHVFEPLEMTNTGYDHNDGSLAVGYTGENSQWERPAYIDMSIPHAAGGLFSTVEDLYRWDQALGTGQLVSQESLDQMFTPYIKVSEELGAAYGLFVGTLDGRPAMGHDGGIEGFATHLRRYPEDGVTIIALSNRDSTDINEIVDQIADIIFEK